MPFHIHGKKPRYRKPEDVETFRFTLKRRLILLGMGVLGMLAGVYQILYAPLLSENWQHMPANSMAFVTIGVPLVVLALLPSSWVEKLMDYIATGQPPNWR
jgi:hypothetical protein